MAGRGRGRANTLPAWMTKQGLDGPPAGTAPGSRSLPSGPPPGRNGQFEDAPEPRGSIRNGMGEPSGGKRRSRSRERGNGRNGGDFRGPPPMQERPRSRCQDRGNGCDRDRGNGYDREREYRSYEYGADRRREDPYRRGPPRGRSRSRSRERRDYRCGDRYEDRGYSARGDEYRRNDGRPLRDEMERGYRRPPPNGHDDRTSCRYASDYQP